MRDLGLACAGTVGAGLCTFVDWSVNMEGVADGVGWVYQWFRRGADGDWLQRYDRVCVERDPGCSFFR